MTEGKVSRLTSTKAPTLRRHILGNGLNNGERANTFNPTAQSLNQSPSTSQELPVCPECGSSRLYRDGFRYSNGGEPTQRYLCRNCGYRFSQSLQTVQNVHRQSLNANRSLPSNRRVCAEKSEAKNLDAAAIEKQTAAGTTPQQNLDTKGRIVEYVFHLQKEGLRDSTLEQKHQLLQRLLALGADLDKPDTVKAAIARLERSESYKLLLCIAYEGFAKYHGIPWTRPNYKQCERLPFIPHETEIDALIAGTDRKTSALLRLLKETAMRLGETWQLEWTHLDIQSHVITCNNPEKNSRPRIFNVTPDLIQMLDKLPKVNQYVFGCGRNVQEGKIDPKLHMKLLHRQKSRITNQRERVATKLQNPRIRQISYHTLRHWKATMLYHQTKDILHVMKFLGHKGLKNTLIYIDLEIACFPNGVDDYVGKVATTQTEALGLIEAGFEHVCVTPDGTMYFRKRR